MEFLTGLASIWAIIWTLLFFAVLVGTVEHESGAASLIVLAVGVTVLEVTGTTSITAWVIANPVRFAVLAAVYFLAGGVWALIKWWLFVRSMRDEIEQSYASYMKKEPGATLDQFLASYSNPARLSRHQSRIMLWMAWWVPSLFWTILDDLIVGFWRRLYDLLSGSFSAIARRIVVAAIGRQG